MTSLHDAANAVLGDTFTSVCVQLLSNLYRFFYLINLGSSSTLTVEVQSMEHLQGLYITRCIQLNPNQQLASNKEKAVAHQDQDNFREKKVDDDSQQQMYVLFSHNTGQNLKIAVGLRIQIYPPW